MSWFRDKGAQKPDYTGLQLQTSVATLPIPIVWGQNKISANVVWYNNFRSQGGGGGKGGLFQTPASGYNYTADLIMALCEGPISRIGIIWKDQSTYTLSDLGLTFFNGATPQASWGYVASASPNEALAYQGTAYVCAASYQLGASANIGNHNFEVVGILAGTGVNGVDADPAQVINDFLTNPQYGVGLSGTSIDATTLFGPGADGSLQTYCRAQGIAFSPVLATQTQASSVLSRWLQLVNCAAVWSAGRLRFLPYGDVAIPAGNIVRALQVVVPTPPGSSSGATPPPSILVCPPSAFVSDGGVTDAATGAALTYIGTASPSASGQYGLSPQGTYLFSGADESRVVSIVYTYANAYSYTPNLTPVYDLNDLDFVVDGREKDPVRASRVDPFSLPTIQRVECSSRSNQYGQTPVEARDQSQVELYGARVGSAIQALEICDEIVVGPIVAQILLQRQLYTRSHFAFSLSWEYCLLDPMDIVTINDANLGLAQYPVRIVTIAEDEKGILQIEAEEVSLGIGTPAYYPNTGPSSYLPNQGVAAAAVNAPLIFEPPAAMTGDVAQLWVGASGGAGGAADPNWGGAFVWVSLDGISYSQVATLQQPLRQGVLTSTLPLASGWDTIDTLSLSLARSGGSLSGTSLTGAQTGATPCLVDNEVLSYQSAVLTGPFNYNLTGLQRGFGGTPAAAHPSGAAFARLDGAVVKYDLPPAFIGQTIYLKFQSFNIFGAGTQGLASCAAYAYRPTGVGATGAVAASLAAGVSLDYGLVSASASESDDFGDCTSPFVTTIDLGNLTT